MNDSIFLTKSIPHQTWQLQGFRLFLLFLLRWEESCNLFYLLFWLDYTKRLHNWRFRFCEWKTDCQKSGHHLRQNKYPIVLNHDGPNEWSKSISFPGSGFQHDSVIFFTALHLFTTFNAKSNQFLTPLRSILTLKSHLLIPCNRVEKLSPVMIPASFILSASDDIEDDIIETIF